MNNVIVRIKTIKDSYIQHTDTSIAEAKNIANFMYNMDKNTSREQVYRKFLDFISVIKYLDGGDVTFNDKNRFVHLGKALINLGKAAKGVKHGGKLLRVVKSDIYTALKRTEKMIDEAFTEGKQNEKSITFPKGLSPEGQEKLYSIYRTAHAYGSNCLEEVVTKVHQIETRDLAMKPSEGTLYKWIFISPMARNHFELYGDNPVKKTKGGFNKGSYNMDNINAGYNELAWERDSTEPSVFERGFEAIYKKLFVRKKD